MTVELPVELIDSRYVFLNSCFSVSKPDEQGERRSKRGLRAICGRLFHG